MPHDVSLIATVAIGFALAFPFGYIAQRLRLPPLVGSELKRTRPIHIICLTEIQP